MTYVASFGRFIKESPNADQNNEEVKGTVVSKDVLEKLNEVYEAACSEMKGFHEDDNSDHDAQGYLSEYESAVQEIMENIMNECKIMMGPKQPGEE